MRIAFLAVAICVFAAAALGQDEQAPISQANIVYQSWTYRSVASGQEVSLTDLARGKKLVLVVYFAPWCPNWRSDAPMLERFYQKYKSAGLEIVGIGEYDTVASMKNNIEFLKISFPVVYESEQRGDRLKTTHFRYRAAAGDKRSWGSPWYIFLAADKIALGVNEIQTSVVNGQLFEAEAEKLVRKRLGLAPAAQTTLTYRSPNGSEVCDPSKSGDKLKLPDR